MSKNPTINGQEIPWAMVRRINKMCGGDWDQTMDAFWKARGAKGERGIIKYVLHGFVPNKDGVRYSLMPSKERDAGKMQMIRNWWRNTYQTKNKPMSFGAVMRQIAQDM